MPDIDAVYIFDLDGTVLDGNSFPLWVKFLLIGRIRGLAPGPRLRLRLEAGGMLALRKAGLLSHDALKAGCHWASMRASRDIGDAWIDEFVARMLARVRPGFRGLLEAVAARRIDAVLATAAAETYATRLGARLGFGHVLATVFAGPGSDAANLGAAKRDRVMAYLAQLGWAERRRVFFTDHRDDLPLAEICDRTCWFGPSAKLPTSPPAPPLTNCDGLDHEAVLAAAFAL